MCYCCKNVEKHSVKSIQNSEETNLPAPDLPEHVDNAYLNRNVQTGILGFRYETKNSNFIIYSSVEAMTFCILMNLKPLCN